jgi:hypothetical protein
MKDLSGKTAFVTGAASGIGLGIATALARAGVKVMLCDIEEAVLAKAVADLKLTNADVGGVRGDVSLKAELQAAADATVARYGKVHILVNNAGVGGGGNYGRWTDASWNWTLGVNLMSVVWGVEIFGPLIEAHGEGGQIVSTASIAGLIPGSAPAYNVPDAGLRIGCDIGRIDHPERGCHRVAARERLTALCCVTRRAIAPACKSFALRDQIRRKASRCRRHDRSDGGLPRQHAKTCEPEASEGDGGDEQLLEHGVL